MEHRQLTVVVALIERDGLILLTRRNDPEHPQWHHRWEFPGGKIDAGESPLEALQREVMEETRLSVHSIRLLGVHTQHWKTSTGIQQTFVLLHHCQAGAGDVVLDPNENDLFVWEDSASVVCRNDMLDGNVRMFKELYMDQMRRHLDE